MHARQTLFSDQRRDFDLQSSKRRAKDAKQESEAIVLFFSFFFGVFQGLVIHFK